MLSNNISPFEYVSILVSIILGLGITQLLSSFSDLLYRFRQVKHYWPHTVWVCFVLFLLVQDWFITYQLRDHAVWHLPELLFILAYPIALFTTAKMLLPTNEGEEQLDMHRFYHDQYPVIFFITAISITLSILFNIWLLHKPWLQQTHLFVFLAMMLCFSYRRSIPEILHRIIALVIGIAAVVSVVLEKDVWVIR